MRSSLPKQPQVKGLRCAIYTRVSTEHGLEQEFNSLDNQREAAEAYIKSQAHEGWRMLPARYDDGGYSGGSMDRPGLKQLLSDIQARLIDVVVVYKVDRLTRSLADFAKLVELFDEHGVSFVSVTQSFNTTSSMGRLTLNVLLSFAQFEREVTGERIRDKIAASKKKGIWMGGHVPLGYRITNRKLVVCEEEAEQVRQIFRRYLEVGSLTMLIESLNERQIVTKERRLSSGKVRGGIRFTPGPLAYLLKNRTYLGEIVHKGQRYSGEHEAIVDRELFEAVQERLRSGACERRKGMAATSPLVGRIFDDRGNRMTPTHANKGGARYRYYVSCALLQGRKAEAGSMSRIPAPDVEAIVARVLREHAERTKLTGEPRDAELVQELLERVTVRNGTIDVLINGSEGALQVPWSPAPHARKRAVILAEGQDKARPIRAEARARLLEGIAKARHWLDELVTGSVMSTEQIAKREGVSERSVRMTLNLAFLAPDLVQAAVDGTLPASAGLSALSDLPPAWTRQRDEVAALSERFN